MPYHVFVIHPSGKVEHTTQPKAPDLEQLQRAVGGYIETVPYLTRLAHEGVVYNRGRAYADEDGMMKGKPINQPATLAWKACIGKHAYGLLGSIVFYAKGKENA